MNKILKIKFLIVFVLTIYCYCSIFISISEKPSGDILSLSMLFIGYSPWTVFYIVGISFPIVFMLSSYFIKVPFSNGIRLIFLLQFPFICFFLWAVYIAIGFYNKDTFSIYKYANAFLPWTMAYYGLVFFFSLWGLALLFPNLAEFKLFNWPFEKREGYEEPKKWIPPRER